MNWKSTGIVACVATALSLASMASAQTPPPGPPQGDGQRQGPPRDDRDGPPPRDGQVGPPRDGQGGPGGPGGRGDDGDPRGPNHPARQRDEANRPQAGVPGGDFGRFNGYLSMVDTYSKLARDPEAAGVAAVVSAGDVLRRKGPEAAIDYFNKILPEVSMDGVKRAIRLQLVDLYKDNKQEDKALEQLQMLMTATATTAAPSESLKK